MAVISQHTLFKRYRSLRQNYKTGPFVRLKTVILIIAVLSSYK